MMMAILLIVGKMMFQSDSSVITMTCSLEVCTLQNTIYEFDLICQ